MSLSLTPGQRQTLLEMLVGVMYLPLFRITNHQFGVTIGNTPVLSGGRKSLLSLAYRLSAKAIWRLLLTQLIPLARSFARNNAGSSIAARMAMIAITTSNSISVNARECRAGFPACRFGRLSSRPFLLLILSLLLLLA